MLSFFLSGGIFMWVILVLALVVLGLTIKKAIDLFGSSRKENLNLEAGINAILFWGGISVVVGFFSHYYGIYLAMQAISRARDISPGIVAMGYGVSLISIISSLLVFLFSAIAWFTLRWRFKILTSQTN